jgi:hypothetical protein
LHIFIQYNPVTLCRDLRRSYSLYGGPFFDEKGVYVLGLGVSISLYTSPTTRLFILKVTTVVFQPEALPTKTIRAASYPPKLLSILPRAHQDPRCTVQYKCVINGPHLSRSRAPRSILPSECSLQSPQDLCSSSFISMPAWKQIHGTHLFVLLVFPVSSQINQSLANSK